MKQLIWIIVLFAIAMGIALAAKTYSGNVFIVVESYLVRINLHLFIVALVLGVVLLYLLIKLLSGVLATPERVSLFSKNHRSRQASKALNAAGLAFFEGKYQQAEQAASKVLTNKEAGANRVLALMIGAHAANQMGNKDLRNQYLADIAKLPEKQQLSRHLLLAESALNAENNEEASNHLKAAAQINPSLTRLVQLQLRQASHQGNALEMLDKANKLQRAGAINNQEAQRYTDLAYEQLLSLATDADSMKAALKRIPSELANGRFCVKIADRYVQLGLYPQAIKWVGKHYPISHDGALLPAFTNSVPYLDEHAQNKAMDTATSWVKDSPNDAQLLAHLGKLAYSQQLWGKAKNYLETSLKIEPSNNTRLALAKVFDEVGDKQAAAELRQLILNTLTEDE